MKVKPLVAAQVLAFLGLILGSVSPTFAQDDMQAAKAHYSKATRLYEVGEYRQAIDEFKAAHLAKADPSFLYNIAQCHRQLGEFEPAVTLYKRFLGASPKAANRADVEKRVAEIEADLAAKKREAAAGMPAPTRPLNASAVDLPAQSLPAQSPVGREAGSALTPHSSGLVVEPVAVTVAVTAAGVAPPGRAASGLRYLRWIGVGVTLGLVGGALATGLSASSRYDDLKNTCGTTGAGCSNGAVDGVKSRALLTNILWGVAGVAAVGTGVAFYLAPHESAIQVAWKF
jgi:tetratricopeptide (TPR) repeat protein